MAGFVIVIVRAFAVGVLMCRVAVVVMILAGGAVIMTAIFVQIAGVGGGRDDQKEREGQRKKKRRKFANQKNTSHDANIPQALGKDKEEEEK